MDLSHYPALPPPDGVIPNFVDPVSQASICLITIAITLPLMVIFLVLRMYVRLRVTHKIGTDDALCLLSAALVIAFCGITLSFLNNPVGYHQWDVPITKITVLFDKLTLASVVLYALACMAVKSTLLLLYLRVFSPAPNAIIIIWSGIGFVVIFYTISFIVTLATCLPHAGDGGWASEARGVRCESQDEVFAEAQGIVGALTDFYVLFIPMYMLSGLRLTRKRKFGVYGVFVTGLLACVVSVINAVYRFKVFQNGDPLWVEVPIYALCAAELNIGIICACMPVVFVLFKGVAVVTASLAARLRSWTTRSSSRSKTEGTGDIELGRFAPMQEGDLPSIPKGTLSGLKSFMRRAHRSRPTQTDLVLTKPDYGELLTYVSADYDYHEQLRGRQGAVSTAGPSSKTWQLSRTYESRDTT